jgi:hypothetical protein
VDDSPRPEKVSSFYVASPIRPAEADLPLDSREPANFIGPKNSSVQTDNPLIKRAMSALGEAWPEAIHFQDLLARARRSRAGGSSAATAGDAEDARTLGELLLRAYAGGIVEFSLAPPRLVSLPTEKPAASPLARLQSREGTEVVNLRHFNIRVEDPLSRRLLQLLDGSQDRNALVDNLAAAVESGAAVVETDHGAITGNPGDVRRFLAVELERKLAELAEMALLVA